MITVPMDTPNVIALLVLLSSTVKVSLLSTRLSGAMAMFTHCLTSDEENIRNSLTPV